MKEESRRAKVEKALDKVWAIDGGWDIMLDIVKTRWVVGVLRERRWDLEMTQQELGDLIGISQVSVAEFENARYPDPYLSTLGRYARALKVNFSIDVAATPQPPEQEQDPVSG